VLDSTLGTQIGLVADDHFWSSGERAGAGCWPWTSIFLRLKPSANDFETLLTSSPSDARVAAHWLFSKSALNLIIADHVTPIRLSSPALEKYAERAESDRSSWELWSGAAPIAAASSLLPWMLNIAQERSRRSEDITYSHQRFGEIKERRLAIVYRAIGQLGQTLAADKPAEARKALAGLQKALISLQDENLSGLDLTLVDGAATGLAYLGDWQPLLSHLARRGSPWLCEAARNTFANWVPGAFAPNDDSRRASEWIVARLRNQADLTRDVKATLESIDRKLRSQR
jgi:hypothetical protein